MWTCKLGLFYTSLRKDDFCEFFRHLLTLCAAVTEQFLQFQRLYKRGPRVANHMDYFYISISSRKCAQLRPKNSYVVLEKIERYLKMTSMTPFFSFQLKTI